MPYGKQYLYTLTKRYATFSGRASRREYWTFFIVSVLIVRLFRDIGYALSMATGVEDLNYILPLVAGLFFLVPSLAVTVRRLHDHDKPWTWIFILLIPIVGGFLLMGQLLGRNNQSNGFLSSLIRKYTVVFLILLPIVGIIAWLVLMLGKGQPFANQFGEIPLDTADGL